MNLVDQRVYSCLKSAHMYDAVGYVKIITTYFVNVVHYLSSLSIVCFWHNYTASSV